MRCRLPPPSLLFTAIVATAVLLPWAVNGVPGDRPGSSPATAGDTALAQQPLTGLGAGETIREVSQDDAVLAGGAHRGGPAATTARVRAKKPDGSWGPWYHRRDLEGDGPDGPRPGSRHRAGVRRPHHHGADLGHPPAAAVTTAATRRAKSGLGYVPADVEQPFAQDVNAVLISPPQSPADQFSLPTAVTPPGQPPAIIGRAQWGADESMRCGRSCTTTESAPPSSTTPPGSNDYSPQDSAEIVRAIYAYHTRTLGWCDIAYNALVDKYGQVFEGRAGGIDEGGGGLAHRRLQP